MSIVRKLIHFVPFGYLWQTRLGGFRDFVFNALSAWIPGWFLLVMLGGYEPFAAIGLYAIGYVSFVAFYEVGYLANDTAGTRHDETPRRRLKVSFGAIDFVVFLIIRATAWAGIGWLMGWTDDWLWWTFYTALGVVTVYHNVVANSAYKAVSFIQMSLMRFVGPVLFLLPASTLPLLLALALIAFTYHRFVTYLASKGRLDMPERKARWYYVRVSATLLPIASVIAVATESFVPVALMAYLVAIHLLNGLANAARTGQADGLPTARG
ncbi:hypothetical protein D1610_14790 [Sphingomonas gilva]|uniref:Uncharacterized protein n=1 Tax=Sphingomonas gilva TaxID=2305907 RepID=A0A396RM09_9SPHN|nr:hypothetical protein [Sphingomonas gilva]RHW16656.1 hypothetical protein D1610_14790 [Sphingomonas gilva]